MLLTTYFAFHWKLTVFGSTLGAEIPTQRKTWIIAVFQVSIKKQQNFLSPWRSFTETFRTMHSVAFSGEI